MKHLALAVVLLSVAGCALPPDAFSIRRPSLGKPAEFEVREALPAGESTPRLNVAYDELNDYARFLAGMSGGRNARFRNYRSTPAWEKHSSRMDVLWSKFERQRYEPIRSWRSSELGSLASHETVFYPFSGPDFLFANAFFPGADTYVLCGLEPSNAMPDIHALTGDQRQQGLDGIYTSLTTALNFSFFITKDMRVDLQRTKFSGTLPILLTFLARTDHTIADVEPIGLSPAGTLQARTGGHACPGFEIRAISRAGERKAIYYFTENLANGNLASDKRLLAFLSTKGAPVTYVKSASYLMHGSGFSIVRNAILNRSAAILQDDTGVPLKHFDTSKWDLTFYGNYKGTLQMFSQHYQPKLASIYRAGGENVRPMDFGVGYKFNAPQSSQILARRR